MSTAEQQQPVQFHMRLDWSVQSVASSRRHPHLFGGAACASGQRAAGGALQEPRGGRVRISHQPVTSGSDGVGGKVLPARLLEGGTSAQAAGSSSAAASAHLSGPSLKSDPRGDRPPSSSSTPLEILTRRTAGERGWESASGCPLAALPPA